MNTNQKLFIEESRNEERKNFQNIYTYMRKLDFPETDICNWDSNQFSETIINSKPNSLQDVSSMIFATEEFLKWLIRTGRGYNTRCISEIRKVNRQMVFNLAVEQNGLEKKYISYTEYRKAMDDISGSEINDIYFKALLCAIYEGIYSDDLSVIMRLKETDIHGNTINIQNADGETWSIEVSDECAELLIRNARIQDYYIVAPYGGYRTEKVFCGYDGSANAVFKTANRGEGANRKSTCRASYCGIIRKMDVYFGRHVKPKSIFISGVMRRAAIKLANRGYMLDEAFVYRNGNKEALEIVLNEFKRSNYQMDGKKLRENIKGHISEFQE